MKPITIKRNSNHSEDDLVRYKINKKYVNNANKSPAKIKTKKESMANDDDTVRYKLPKVSTKMKQEKKSKAKPKIKVNFWSKKLTNRLKHSETKRTESNLKQTDETYKSSLLTKPKSIEVKVRKQVSFLPSPLFSDNHDPMVTVPDDLTLQLNEEEANALHDDLNHTNTNNASNNDSNKLNDNKILSPQVSPRSNRHKRNLNNNETKSQGNENELEYFSKYIVQKLRRMETNQRIYSENLINTVLMLGQLGKLNGKSKVSEP
ncbi:PREDICTED: myb-like protein W [Papilio xuthus]|nr:PREDICTED: myb-like protein W [Papilio xuthus]